MRENKYIPVKPAQIRSSTSAFLKQTSRPFFPPAIQPNLTVNPPDDIYEKEADAVPDRVMGMSEPSIQQQDEEEEEMLQMKEQEHTPAIQRKCAVCEAEESSSLQRQTMEEEEEVMMKSQPPMVQRKCAVCEEKEKALQRKSIAGSIFPLVQRKVTDGQEVNGRVASSFQTGKSGGRPLSDGTRSWMESRFGADFSGVKVHTDSKAVQLSRDLNAKAFTHGSNIYFNSGRFAPGTNEGKRLLAHELTHVVQQNRQTVSSQTLMRSPLFISTMEICRRVLRSRTFEVTQGGLVVSAHARWEGPSHWCGPDHGYDRYNMELRKEGTIFDSGYGNCEFQHGEMVTRTWANLPNGKYHLSIWTNNTNPNCCLRGDIIVSQDSHLTGETCTQPPPGPLETLHTVLDIAGLIPALGVVPDSVNAGIYIIQGDWTNAGISAAAMVPIFGGAAAITRIGGRTVLRITGSGVRKTSQSAIAARLRQARNLLRTMRAPRAVPWGRTTGSIDARLLERAKEVRATQAGVTTQAFRQHNVATARVRVDGEVRYLDTGNMPRGAHSEEYLHAQITELRRGGNEVRLEQLYTERIPCRPTCGPLLGREYPNADVFFTTKANNAAARAQELMEAYGLATR